MRLLLAVVGMMCGQERFAQVVSSRRRVLFVRIVQVHLVQTIGKQLSGSLWDKYSESHHDSYGRYRSRCASTNIAGFLRMPKPAIAEVLVHVLSTQGTNECHHPDTRWFFCQG